ncbi:MAG: hypothetical protein N3D20_02735 [Candidatus Pacearchaeota archaeon]|nr:hypothetical protein [Candidatus Pacearchaeota archaeon]
MKKLLFFPDLIKKLRAKTKKEFEIHLMVKNPEDFIDMFKKAGADIILFHSDSVKNIEGVIRKIKEKNMKVGIVIKIDQQINLLKKVIDNVNTIVIMGTKLGIKGKKFNKKSLTKIKKIKEIIEKRNLSNIEIEVDGGIRDYSVPLIVKAGGTMVVCGSIIFHKDYKKTCKWLRNI